MNVGIGGTACIIDLGSVTSRIGRKFPATTGVSGVVNALNTRLHNTLVIPTGKLI